ncbi:MAG: hypothetical protein ACK4XK_12730 [Casimicrobiaceae bacterium]
MTGGRTALMLEQAFKARNFFAQEQRYNLGRKGGNRVLPVLSAVSGIRLHAMSSLMVSVSEV